jgi:hypothetical protein
MLSPSENYVRPLLRSNGVHISAQLITFKRPSMERFLGLWMTALATFGLIGMIRAFTQAYDTESFVLAIGGILVFGTFFVNGLRLLSPHAISIDLATRTLRARHGLFARAKHEVDINEIHYFILRRMIFRKNRSYYYLYIEWKNPNAPTTLVARFHNRLVAVYALQESSFRTDLPAIDES